MAEYALRLANGADTAPRVRAGDALGLAPNGAIRARGGLRPDGGGAVTVPSGTMTVSVSPFSCWVDASPTGQVGYPFVLDAAKTLTIDPGDATLARVDLVAVVVREGAYDGGGTTSATLQIVKGTPGAGVPALPTSASLALREVNVPAGASSGSGGLSSGNLGTDRRTYTGALGGLLVVAGTTDRPSSPYDGQPVYRRDTDQIEVWNGSRWDPVGPFGSWVDDLASATSYNFPVAATAWGTVISSGGPYNVTVPAGRTLEVEFRAPLIDCPAGTGVQARLLIAGTVMDAGYLSNSNAASFAMPVNLSGKYTGTGAQVAVQVEAIKVGGGAPSIQAGGIAPVRIRHRIT